LVSYSSLKTINIIPFVNNSSFSIIIYFVTFFYLETWRLKLFAYYLIRRSSAFECLHFNILVTLSPLFLVSLFSSLF
jgi:predicted MPP superfamily phosphohydrolase